MTDHHPVPPTQVELETEQEDLKTLCAGATLRNSKKLGAFPTEAEAAQRTQTDASIPFNQTTRRSSSTSLPG